MIKNLYGFLSDFQLIFKRLKIYSNNVIEASIFCQFFLIYDNFCLENHQSDIIKKTKKRWKNLVNDIKILLKKKNEEHDHEWYKNLSEDKYKC